MKIWNIQNNFSRNCCPSNLLFHFTNICMQSSTKGCRQIYKIREIRFLNGMFYSGIFAIFYKKTSKFGFWVPRCVRCSPLNRSISEIFSKFPNFQSPKPQNVGQLVNQFLHSFSADNNLLSFHLWWREIALKREKVYKCFVQDCRSAYLNVR